MNWQRLLIGLIGFAMLATGAVMYFLNPQSATALVGIMVRVGVLLCVTWLAFPELEPIKSKIPGYLLLVILAMLVIVAARPKLFQVVAGLLAVALALSWALKWVSKLTSNPPR